MACEPKCLPTPGLDCVCKSVLLPESFMKHMGEFLDYSFPSL